MLLDELTDIKQCQLKTTIACTECGAMYSRVRMESQINRSYCKYKVMLAKSKTIQSITYHRDNGIYGYIFIMVIISVRVEIRYLHPMGSYHIQLLALPSYSTSECSYCFCNIDLLYSVVVSMNRIHITVFCYTLSLDDLIHISNGFNRLFTYSNICLAFISSLFNLFLTYQIIHAF